MKLNTNVDVSRHEDAQAATALWVAVIVASGMAVSLFFACATPFAAFATVAALKLDRQTRYTAIGLLWLTNQAIGYGWLGYPWTWNSAAWGCAIGASSALAVMAAAGLSTTRSAPLAVTLPFMAAFTVFELTLYMAGWILPGSSGAFTFAIVSHIFLINAVTLLVVMLVHHSAHLVSRLLLPTAVPSMTTRTASL